MTDKFGNFDWIVNFDQLKPYVVQSDHSSTVGSDVGPAPPRKALVIGCGTSRLSERLVDAGFDLVVSMDNDAGLHHLFWQRCIVTYSCSLSRLTI
jgi:hypothetical protein